MDAEQLYRLPPEQFTAERDAEVKRRRAEGDKEGAAALKALRRPSVAAWLLNRLVEQDPALLEGVLELGPGLAEAQASGDAGALRALGAQRRSLVEAVTGSAVAAGRRAVTAAVREEVAATLEAALADPASAAAVRSGRLVRSLSYAGFGEVDLSGAVAPQDRPRGATVPEPAEPARRRTRAGTSAAAALAQEQHAARVAEAEAAAHHAAGRLDDAVRSCEAAERSRAEVQGAAEELRDEVARRAAALAQAQQELERATSEVATAQRAADKAQAAVQRAQTRAEAARTELDRLRRTGPAEG